jgi:hypothetical protein
MTDNAASDGGRPIVNSFAHLGNPVTRAESASLGDRICIEIAESGWQPIARGLTRSGPMAKKGDSQGGDNDVPMTGGQLPEWTIPEPAV